MHHYLLLIPCLHCRSRVDRRDQLSSWFSGGRQDVVVAPGSTQTAIWWFPGGGNDGRRSSLDSCGVQQAGRGAAAEAARV